MFSFLKKSQRTKLDAPKGGIMRKLAMLGRREDGTATIEFSIVSIPYYFLLGATFELGIQHSVGLLLDYAVADVARQIKTGQITAQTHNEAQFRTVLCSNAAMAMFDCSKVKLDVRTVAQFEEPTFDKKADGSLDDDDFGFSPGGVSTVNVIRVFYEWPVYLAYADINGKDMWSDGKRLHMSSAAFVKEPG